MKRIKNFYAYAVMAVLCVSCNSAQNSKQKDLGKEQEDTKSEDVEIVEVAKKDCSHVHWSHHKGEESPDNWKNLCDGFKACGGEAQSPINIYTDSVAASNDLLLPEFNYTGSKVNIINNSHTVQFNVDSNNHVMLNGKEYQLLQFHYHATSEHTIDDNYYPLEVHFVHKHSDTEFAVIGVMIVEGENNGLFSKYLDHFPTEKGEYNSAELIDIISLFPENKSYYHYSGSLTTPPCSEIVSWYILQNPIEASKEQIAKFSEILNDNFRPVMPLNNRKILGFVE